MNGPTCTPGGTLKNSGVHVFLNKDSVVRGSTWMIKPFWEGRALASCVCPFPGWRATPQTVLTSGMELPGFGELQRRPQGGHGGRQPVSSGAAAQSRGPG